MTDQQCVELQDAFKKIFGFDLELKDIKEICDMFFFEYPSLLQDYIEEKELQNQISSDILSAKLTGRTIEEWYTEMYEIILEQTGKEDTSPLEILAYYNTHKEIFNV